MSESHFQMTLVSMIRCLYPELVINLSLNGISLNGLSPKQKAQLITQAKKEGMENGIQDLSLYLPQGKVLNLELKTATGKQSADQIDIQAKLNHLEHTYHVVRDVYQVLELIALNTTATYRIEQYQSLPIHGDTLIDQFMHFPAGTPTTAVQGIVKDLYHI